MVTSPPVPLLAVGSYYLAKKDPYVLKGINDVKDKLEEAERPKEIIDGR